MTRERLKLGKIGLGTEHLEQKPEVIQGVLRAAVEAVINYVDLLYVETAPA